MKIKYAVDYYVDDYKCEGGGLQLKYFDSLNKAKAFVRYLNRCNTLVTIDNYLVKKEPLRIWSLEEVLNDN